MYIDVVCVCVCVRVCVRAFNSQRWSIYLMVICHDRNHAIVTTSNLLAMRSEKQAGRFEIEWERQMEKEREGQRGELVEI